MSAESGSLAPRRRRSYVSNRRVGGVLVALCVTILSVSGCASVSDVKRWDADLERKMGRTVDDQLSAARAENQRRIAELEKALATRNAEYARLAERLNQSESRLAELAAMLAGRLEGIAKDSADLRRIAGRLDSEIERLPLETLEQLELAIERHIAVQRRAVGTVGGVGGDGGDGGVGGVGGVGAVGAVSPKAPESAAAPPSVSARGVESEWADGTRSGPASRE